MRINTLLIYPEFPDTFWSFKHALAFVGRKASLPPLGLLTVAGMLPRDWPKQLVDVNVNALSDTDLEWADCVFLSAMGVQAKSVVELIARCKAAGLLIVAGGPLFQSARERFADVDHFVLNESELTLPAFLHDLEKGHPQREYSSEGFPDLSKTPAPMWELLDLRRYWSMSIQFSRGCPFNCDFCNVTAMFGHSARTKPASQIIDELDGLYDLGWRGEIFFVDDNFIGQKAFLKKDLLPALTAWRKDKIGNGFFTEASINLADDQQLLDMMVEAGFNGVFIGIETTDNDSLVECNKVQNRNRDMVADVKRIQRAGLQVQGGFIVGFDHDGPTIFQKQIDFIQKSGIVTAMVGLLQAPPGTRLFARMKREGRLREAWSGDNVDGTTNIIPTMGFNALMDGYRNLLDYIYAPEHYYARIRTFLREYRPVRMRGGLRFSHIMALLRSIYWLGLVDHERRHYWKLIIWTQFRRPSLVQEAVTLSIYGYHFRKVCELHVRKTGQSLV